jgi:tungstate transport system ATP-binding protein
VAPLYRLEGIRKDYDGKTVLDIPFLAIREGTFTSLNGPNGSGKSTLLGILAFLCHPTSGMLCFSGGPVVWKEKFLGILQREVTLLHQNPYLFDGTVEANVAYGLKVRGVATDERRRRVVRALETVGLEGFGERRARALSGGEMQRVALARALVLSPRVLLLDEPLARIDRHSAAKISGIMADLPRRGTTVVMATHDPKESPGEGAGRIRLKEGKLQDAGKLWDDGRDPPTGESGHALF